MSQFIRIITASDKGVRDTALEAIAKGATIQELMEECTALERFRRDSTNLYERVRAQFFLYAIHRFFLPPKLGDEATPGKIPFAAQSNFLKRRFEEAIDILLQEQSEQGVSAALSSGLAGAYKSLAFKTLAGQVRRSVRSVKGNQWMSRAGHPEDYPLTLRPEILEQTHDGLFPVIKEQTPVRMDLTHTAWSDIFFLGMDYPEGARVLNVSVDLSVRAQDGTGEPAPPVEAYFRVIDEPVLRLTSIDLGATTDVSTFAEVFDYARDYLGLLKGAVIASGLIPPSMEGAHQSLGDLLMRLTGRRDLGVEIVSRVRDIPKGSRLAVSTNLLACLISVCMRATGQISSIEGPLTEPDRRLVAARAILGEWLGGSGGGWQDSGGVWPGIKLIEGAASQEGDPEFGVSRGRLLPNHYVFGPDEITAGTRQKLQDSLVVVHGGMAQDVGPVLEMVTERYLLRSEREWNSRLDATEILDAVIASLQNGNVRSLGNVTERNFFGPIQAIIPWASNLYTETLISTVRKEFGDDFWGFWMMGGMSGGGMGFMFHPDRKQEAQTRLQDIMREAKRRLENAVPFAMEPVVYNFAINERGTFAQLLRNGNALMPASYYSLNVPALLRIEARSLPRAKRAELDRLGSASRSNPDMSQLVPELFDRLLPKESAATQSGGRSLEHLLAEFGFDRVQHEQIKTDLKNSRIGLAQNRLPVTSRVEDARAGDVYQATLGLPAHYREIGLAALKQGTVAVISLAGGVGSRWTHGAGVVKALNPFSKFDGKYRTFVETHLAKTRYMSRICGHSIPHVFTTSFLTHPAIESYLRAENNYRFDGPLLLSPGRSIGLRMVPTVRDLRFAWTEISQQLLDEQKQKVRDSLRAALLNWALQAGEGSDYTDNLPLQCLNPIGHWYEVPNLFRNGVLAKLLEQQPALRYLMVHNIDTLGANADPAILGLHIERGAVMTTEVIARHFEDRGGGLARIDGRLQLIESLALPNEEVESTLSFYNSNTFWIDIDQLLKIFGLSRQSLSDEDAVMSAMRRVGARMPTYITLKEVKKRWGRGQEDIFPVAQWEKLWGDMTTLEEMTSLYVEVSRYRGQQLKEPAQLDGWLRDGSAAYVDSICAWQ